jgi:hypothetical protein
MNRQKVSSTQIKEIGYDEKTSTLEIEFHRGNVYQYHPITKEGYEQMMKAESPGKFFHANIKNNELVTCKKV